MILYALVAYIEHQKEVQKKRRGLHWLKPSYKRIKLKTALFIVVLSGSDGVSVVA